MYILFAKDMDINSKSIGCSSYVKPFTVGVYIDDLNQLKKIVEEVSESNITDDEGRQLYIDKNHVISTNVNGKKMIQKTTSCNIVDFAHYPKMFSLYDIMICKKQSYINQGYNNAMLYEFNLDKFINLEESDNYDAGVNSIKLKNNGVLSLLPLNLNDEYITVKIHSDYPISVLYSYDNKNYKKAETFKNKHKPLYLKFKNSSNQENVIYDYQILTKEVR